MVKKTIVGIELKFLVFNSHNFLGYEGKWCYLDLDIIIQNDITDLDELALNLESYIPNGRTLNIDMIESLLMLEEHFITLV